MKKELHLWIANIIIRNWSRSARAVEAGAKIEDFLSERLAGLKISRESVILSLRKAAISKPIMKWNIEDALTLAKSIQNVSKPIVVAANKADIASEDNKKKLVKELAILVLIEIIVI